MPSVYRAFIFATHAASLALFFAPELTSIEALAKPVPLPAVSFRDIHRLELAPRSAKSKTVEASKSKTLAHKGAAHTPPDVAPAAAYRSVSARHVTSNSTLGAQHVRPVYTDRRALDVSNILNNINLLNSYYGKANDNAQNLSQLLSL